jgi:hypothetical protein
MCTNFYVDKNANAAVQTVKDAAKLGFNGVVVADAKFMRLELYKFDDPRNRYRRNIAGFMAACREHNIEIIPEIGVVSRAKPLLAHDVNLISGYPVRDAVFEVRNRVARIVSDPNAVFLGGGFETIDKNGRFKGWTFQDNPGEVTVADHQTKRSGQQSVRLQPKLAKKLGLCRLNQTINITPHRCYRFSIWVKTEKLDPPTSFRVSITGNSEDQKQKSKPLSYKSFNTSTTQSWKQVDVVFNSMNFSKVSIAVGLWKSRSGQTWLDDAKIEEIGLVNVIRRPGCPLTVKSANEQMIYVEGRDFDPIIDPKLGQNGYSGNYDCYHEAPVIRMHNNIPDGIRLLVSFYHPLIVDNYRVSCCMSEEKTYQVFERAFSRLSSLLGRPKRYLLSYSELATGASCALCKSTGKTPGELLANNVRRFAGIVRKVRPGAEVLVWHDMFDPGHNAHDHYYLVEGTLEGSWEGLDKDIIIVNWSYGKRESSMKFFAKRGHRQISSAYVDYIDRMGMDYKKWVSDWLATMDSHPRVLGIMYNTERNRYSELDTFSRTVREHSKPRTQGSLN